MRKVILLAVIAFSLSACIKEKQSTVTPATTTPVTTTPQEHQYAHFADSLNKSWTFGRAYSYIGTPSWDTAKKQYVYNNGIDTTYTDSTMAITKVNDTTVNFIGADFTLVYVDSTKKMAYYRYMAHQYASDLKSISYYYMQDSVYAEDKYWVSSSSGHRTYKYYSK